MSDRIRQLEDALGSLHARASTDPHPLLIQDLLRIKNSLELYTPQTGVPSQQDPVPSSSLPLPDADPRPSEVFRVLVSCAPSSHPHSQDRSASGEIAPTDIPRLSPEIEKLSQTFPYPWLPNNPMRERIYSMLPSRQEAEYFCTQARLNALWQYASFPRPLPPSPLPPGTTLTQARPGSQIWFTTFTPLPYKTSASDDYPSFSS